MYIIPVAMEVLEDVTWVQVGVGGLWCPRSVMPLGPCGSDYLILLSNAMMTSGSELQLRAISGSVALRSLRVYVDVWGFCCHWRSWRHLMSWTMLVSEGHTTTEACVDLTGLHCYLRQKWHPDPTAAKEHIWVHDPIAAGVCVEIWSLYCHQRLHRSPGLGLHTEVFISGDHAVARTILTWVRMSFAP